MKPVRSDDADFTTFAVAISPALFRTALLLTGDWHLSQDVVQEALGRLYRSWSAINRVDNPAAYAHTVLVRTFLSMRRRRSFHERPVGEMPDMAGEEPDHATRVVLIEALATLSKRDRAVLVLRYLHDRSVDEVAIALDRSPGAIRIQSMRALARLRAVLGESTIDLAHP